MADFAAPQLQREEELWLLCRLAPASDLEMPLFQVSHDLTASRPPTDEGETQELDGSQGLHRGVGIPRLRDELAERKPSVT
jgi:hypothetical protein